MERQEAAAQRIAERLRRALARDAAGALAPLPFPLQPNLTPRRLPSLEPVDLNPPVEGTPRVAAVTALVVPPVALGACGPNGGGDVKVHPFDCQVLLIERAQSGVFGGQLALPGGKAEPGETPEETAARELKEELGIDMDDPLQLIQRVGSLDPSYSSGTGYLIHVVVAVAPTVPHLLPDPTEVVTTVGVRLGTFDPRMSVADVDGTHAGERLRYAAFPAPGNRRVWGLTARLLSELASRTCMSEP